MGLRADRESGEPSLQQGHQSGTPVADHKQQQEWNREVILVVDSVEDGEREISSDQQFDPRNPSQTLPVLCSQYFVFLRSHAVFGGSSESCLLTDERFKNRARI